MKKLSLVFLLWFSAAFAFGQTVIPSTNLAAAVSSAGQFVQLNAAPGLKAGYLLYVDGEAMLVNAVQQNGLEAVQRGASNTRPSTHSKGAQVWFGPPNYFQTAVPTNFPFGSCSSSTVPVLPYINLASGAISDCTAGIWVRRVPVTQTNTLGTKLRRLAAAALNNNPLVNPPLTPPAAWQASTAYTIGTVVTNDSGKNYFCITAGTSAGSGGPTGVGAAVIVDNTASWFYFNVTTTTAAATTAPTVTVSTSQPSGLSTRTAYGVTPTAFFPSGGPPLNVFGSGSSSDWGIAPNSAPAAPSNCGASFTRSGSQTRWSFMTDAPDFAIVTNNNNNAPWRLLVDGQYITISATEGTNAGSPVYYELNYTAAGGRIPRKVTIEAAFCWPLIGVNTTATDSVWAPPATDNLRAIFVGDSITAGAIGNNIPSLDYPSQVGKFLGWNDVWNEGVGGTGYIASSGGTQFSFLGRITDVTNYSPDIIIVMGGTNDSGNSATVITAAVLTYLQALRAALPYTPIVVTGIANSQSANATNINAENAILAAFTAFGDANSYFFPIVTDPNGAWFTGTGNIAAPNGTGNNDVYGDSPPHLSQGGYTYLAQKVTAQLRTIIAQIP